MEIRQNAQPAFLIAGALFFLAIAIFLFVRSDYVAEFLGYERVQGFNNPMVDSVNLVIDFVIKIVNVVCAIAGTYFTYIGVKKNAAK